MNDQLGGRSWLTYGMGGAAAVLLIVAVAVSATGAPKEAVEEKDPSAVTKANKATKTKKKVEPFVLGKCVQDKVVKTAVVKGNPKARAAAQRGLEFLTREAKAWQSQHKCYGCHVQAVTVEALTVGHHHQYDISKKDFDTILGGMLNITGGARTAQGLGHSSASIAPAAKLLGAAAFARYDRRVDDEVTKDLLKNAEQILAYQKPDGSVTMQWNSAPVATGTTQSTAQSMIVWKQAYERSADDQWLTAVQRAEDYLHGVISGWQKSPPQDIQEINYATMGLLAAGVGNTEKITTALQKRLLSLQAKDGAWGGTHGASNTANVALHRAVTAPFATGQTLYTLRLLGLTDSDPAISKGTEWLIKHQQPTGGWSAAGFGKAEAMWAVLGLVSMDVLTIAVEDLKNGQHAEGKHTFKIQAKDNKAGGVLKVEIAIDDIPVHGACGDKLAFTWNTADEDEGKHLVTISATNIKGEVSKRIFEVYTGDVYLTQLGTTFQRGGTVVSMRNIAPTNMSNKVELQIYTLDDKSQADKKVHTIAQDGSQGAMSFFWDGKDGAGNAQKRGKYIARMVFRDRAGNTRQTEELTFVHDTNEAQKADFAQIQGQLNFADGDIAANSEVELLDEEGNIVQRAVSNGMGNYRFRNVDGNRKYRVRLKKKGFKALSAPVSAPAAKEAVNDLKLEAE